MIILEYAMQGQIRLYDITRLSHADTDRHGHDLDMIPIVDLLNSFDRRNG